MADTDDSPYNSFEDENEDVDLPFLQRISSQATSGYGSGGSQDVGKRNGKGAKGAKVSKAKEKAITKAKDRQANKIAKEKEKAAKAAARANSKTMLPAESLKHMIVKIGCGLNDKAYYNKITETLQNSNIKYSSGDADSVHINCISWTRNTPLHLADGEGKVVVKAEIVKEPFLLIVYDMVEMEEHLKNKTLNYQMQFLKEASSSQVTILLYGSVSHLSKSKKSKKKNELVNETDLEYYLTELLLKENVSCVKAETPDELAQIVFQYTKAIAEAPFKKAKKMIDEKANFYMRADNKGCIQTDKDGNGLLQLWCRSITKLPLASLETAQAICEVFPSPSSLLEYIENNDAQIVQKRIADISVRRTADPLGNGRRVGPQLASKLYIFFTCRHGQTVIT